MLGKGPYTRETKTVYRVYRVPRLLIFGNNGVGGLPNTALVANDLKGQELRRVKNNEIIHLIQQAEHSDDEETWTWKGYFRWCAAYVRELWVKGRVTTSFTILRPFAYIREKIASGYANSKFENDSRKWDENLNMRPHKAWDYSYG